MRARRLWGAIASLALLATFAANPAAAATKLRMSTSTPSIEATTGEAKFQMSGQPAGSVSNLQWFNPSLNKWVNLAKFTSGKATASNVPSGFNKFRAQALKKNKSVGLSPEVTVTAREWFGITETPYGFVDRTIRAVTAYGWETKAQVQFTGANACDLVNLGLTITAASASKGDFVGTATLYSQITPPTVLTITASQLKTQMMGVPIKGDVSLLIDTKNKDAAGIVYGVEAHCATRPFKR